MARRQACLTQKALANRAATSQAAISAYESGRRSPSVETLTRILAAAGFELRIRLAELDTHDAAREKAEALLPRQDLDTLSRAGQERVKRASGRMKAPSARS
jgi:transcriptional regulator with XRE-family HTH domain